MISRVWRGWTALEQADAYQELLLGTILPAIRARETPGYLGVRVDRRRIDDPVPEVEFVTTMTFESLDAVIAFAGPEYATAVVPPSARRLLSRFDQASAHYEVIDESSFVAGKARDRRSATGRMVVVYGTPADPSAFDDHYVNVHIPLAKTLPGLRSYEVSRPPLMTPAGGPAPYLIGTLIFDDLAAIRAAFDTPEGRACAADRRVLAPNDADVRMYLFEASEA